MSEVATLRVVTLEAGGCEDLATLCSGLPQVSISACCHRLNELRRVLADAQPDVLVLDADACREDFTGVLPRAAPPVTIVVSSSRALASQAFDLGVIDYLTRPVDPGRLGRALARARERVSAIHALRFWRGLPGAMTDEPPTLCHMTVEKDGRLRFLPTDEIQSIVSCRNYVVVHDATESHIFRSTLKRVEEQLAGQSFLRVERSVLLNLRFVLDVQRLPQRRFRFRMRNGRAHLSGASHYLAIVGYLRQCQPYVEFIRSRRKVRITPANDVTSGA